MATAGTLSLTFVRYLAICAVVASSLVLPSSGYCSSQSDCSSVAYICCASICVYGTDCPERSCTFDSDCLSSESCCDGICSDDCFTLSVGATVGIVMGVCVLIWLLLMCCCYYACNRPSRRYGGRVIVGQNVAATTTITTRCATQTNTPYQYQGQAPPSYQQGYLHNPPPPNRQYPPNSAGSTKSSEPPPLTVVQQREIQGECMLLKTLMVLYQIHQYPISDNSSVMPGSDFWAITEQGRPGV